MKIICDKCNNEFFFKINNYDRHFYTVKCPVCKNPITIKIDLNDTVPGRINHQSRSTSHTSNLPKDYQPVLNEEKKRVAKDDDDDLAAGTQHTSDQIQYNLDNTEVESSEWEYNESGVISVKKQNDIRGIIKAFFAGIDPYYFIEKYLLYGYYLCILLFIFTGLFLFAEIIRFDNLVKHINYWLHPVINMFKHYV